MKIKILLLPVTLICLSACQNKRAGTEGTSSTATDTEATTVQDPSQKTCYAYYKNRDTVILSLLTSGTTLTGDLTYSLYEKDRNFGTVSGEMKGDTLMLNYTFDSEGMQSQRQVAFLKKGNQLTEGYADVEEKNGKIVFKDPTKLKFDSMIKLDKGPCKE